MPTNLSGTVVLIVISPGESGPILSPGTPKPNADLGFIMFCITLGELGLPGLTPYAETLGEGVATGAPNFWLRRAAISASLLLLGENN